MAVNLKKPGIVLLLAALLAACNTIESERVTKIALLAPFEGRYREVGYNALYAARLAISDSNATQIELMAIDDGGQVETVVDRAVAISNDSTIRAVIVLGEFAVQDVVLDEISDIPQFIVGYWGAISPAENRFQLTSATIEDEISENADISLTQITEIDSAIRLGDNFALAQMPQLTESMEAITIISSGNLPDEDFRNRYLESDQFVPKPGLLATLTYDATGIAIEVISDNVSSSEISYSGLNGTIAFDESGFWIDAPINTYHFVDGVLAQVD